MNALWVIHVLRLLAEVIEETIGLDYIRDHFHTLTMMLDVMFDHGLPLLVDKPLLISIL